MVLRCQVILCSLDKVVAPIAKGRHLIDAKTLEDEVANFTLETALIDHVRWPAIIIDLRVANDRFVCLWALETYPSFRVYATHRPPQVGGDIVWNLQAGIY